MAATPTTRATARRAATRSCWPVHRAAVIALHYTGTGVSTILAEGGAGTLDGSIVAGQCPRIDGTCSNNAIETVDQNETNAGTVHLSSTGCGNTGHLGHRSRAHLHQPSRRHRRHRRRRRQRWPHDHRHLHQQGHVNVNVSASYSGGTWTNSGNASRRDQHHAHGAGFGRRRRSTTRLGAPRPDRQRPAQLDGGNIFNQGAGTTSGTEPVLLVGPASGTRVALLCITPAPGHRQSRPKVPGHWTAPCRRARSSTSLAPAATTPTR